MNVEKVIRVLGYIMYTILWSPVIAITLIVLPFIWVAMYVRAGRPIGEALANMRCAIMAGIQHDMNFIKTGQW